jgi:hypothetical protein
MGAVGRETTPHDAKTIADDGKMEHVGGIRLLKMLMRVLTTRI